MTYGEWSALAAIALGSTASMTTANFPQVPSWGCCKDKQGMRKLVACEHEIERMVTKLANYGEIVAAFKNEMRRWHPDRFVSVPEPHKREVQAMAQELYQAFNNAKEKMDRPRSSWD